MGDDDEIQTGDKILLCLSRGPKRIKINGKDLTEINYSGKDYESAKKALEKAGVTVTQEKSYSLLYQQEMLLAHLIIDVAMKKMRLKRASKVESMREIVLLLQ